MPKGRVSHPFRGCVKRLEVCVQIFVTKRCFKQKKTLEAIVRKILWTLVGVIFQFNFIDYSRQQNTFSTPVCSPRSNPTISILLYLTIDVRSSNIYSPLKKSSYLNTNKKFRKPPTQFLKLHHRNFNWEKKFVDLVKTSLSYCLRKEAPPAANTLRAADDIFSL